MYQGSSILFSDLSEHLDRGSGIPLYIQLAHKIETLINKGVLHPEQPLPGNVELGKIAGVNFNTVGKAMARLVDKGLVIRRRRAGTFVSPQATARHGNVGFYYLRERESITLNEAECIQAVLNEQQYDLKLIPIDWEFFKNTDLRTDMRKRGLDGAVLTTLPGNACRQALLGLEKEKFPHVRIGNRYHENQLTSPLITGHDEERTRESFRRLRAVGHRKIGFLGGEMDSFQARRYHQQMDGEEAFCDRWHLPLHFDGPLRRDLNQPLAQIVRGYLHENEDLTAVIVWNPMVASELIKQAEKIDRAVPEILSVICLREGAAFGTPAPCNSFALDKHKMAELCGYALLDELSGTGFSRAAPKPAILNETNPNQVYLPFKYIDRGSVAVNHRAAFGLPEPSNDLSSTGAKLVSVEPALT